MLGCSRMDERGAEAGGGREARSGVYLSMCGTDSVAREDLADGSSLLPLGMGDVWCSIL